MRTDDLGASRNDDCWVSPIVTLYNRNPTWTALGLYLSLNMNTYCYFDCRDKRKKVNIVDTEYTVMKGSLKKNVTQTSTQTDREDKPRIDIADLTSHGISQ
jgi:hypothetical protein